MNKILSILTPGIVFLRSNIERIVFILGSIAILYLAYTITILSLKRLKSENISYYPFDKFFPKSSKWSILYFLITIIFLGALAFFMTKGEFFISPNA